MKKNVFSYKYNNLSLKNNINAYYFNKLDFKEVNFCNIDLIIKTKLIKKQFNEIVKKKEKAKKAIQTQSTTQSQSITKTIDFIILNDKRRIVNEKNKIDQYYKKEWDIIKKITNPFEMIYLTNKQHKAYSLSLYEPISRSYFKMIEILHLFFSQFKNKKQYKKIKTMHLAEGPGGFIEGMINFRENPQDKLFGMTLLSSNSNIPGWNKNNRFLNKQKNVNLISGIDNIGDLYNIQNHLYMIDKFKRNSFDFITGDGGFDFSIDYNLQEEMAAKLIFAQVILGFSLLKNKGSFVCKFFDTYNQITQQILFLLYISFDEIIIYKPFTSRLANSERYLICKKYKPFSTVILLELINILNFWNKIDQINKTNKVQTISIETILNIHKGTYLEFIYRNFISQLNNINKKFEDKQIQNIQETIQLIKNPPSFSWYKEHANIQIKTAANWCKEFGVPYKSYIHNLNYKHLYDLR